MRHTSARFRDLSPEERRTLLAQQKNLSEQDIDVLTSMSLEPEIAVHMIENQISEIEIPMGVVPEMTVNGHVYTVPMATEEPSVIAACSYGVKMIGSFTAESGEQLARGQIVFTDLKDAHAFIALIESNHSALLKIAANTHPSIIRRGGGVRSISTRVITHDAVSVDVTVNVKDAMGANIVNSILEGMSAYLREETHNDALFAILSNYTTEAIVHVSCELPAANVGGTQIAKRIQAASLVAHADPYRAVTHNKGIMNGIDAVVLATGNDTRAVSAAAHAWACRNGLYQSLTQWRFSDDTLCGAISLPLKLGIVGGATKVLPKARAALAIAKVAHANELAEVAAAVGLAQNLAAVRALVSEGIQKGHMSLHARQVAIAVGAQGSQIDAVAKQLRARGAITTTAAADILSDLRQ